MIKGDLIETDLWQWITFLIHNRLFVTVKHIIYLLSPSSALLAQIAHCWNTNKHGRACVCAHVHMQVHNVCTLVRANEQDINGESQHKSTVAKCIMHLNNESHLCLLTFRGRRLHFAALCINTHGFNNLGSSVVIDPVSHSPPFLISSSSSSARGSAFPMSHHIYILQLSRRGRWPHTHCCARVAPHRQRLVREMTALHVPSNMGTD